MKDGILKKCTIVFLILLIFVSAVNPVFAAINESYTLGNPVEDGSLNEKVKSSVIMDALGSFIYSFASLIEKVVGSMFKGLTGIDMFPYADKILFNSIPLLDVNFLNPSKSSLYLNPDESTTVLAKVVRNTYFTILSIAVAFLAVVIGIAAIKLAVSTIASEKAKYKEAITKWLFSVVLLFIMHNLMSFAFWVNEKMVEVASSLLQGEIVQENLDVLLKARKGLINSTVISEFLRINSEAALDDGYSGGKYETTRYKEYLYNDGKADIKVQKAASTLLQSSKYKEYVLFDALDNDSEWYDEWRIFFAQYFTHNGLESIYILGRDVEFLMNGTTMGFTRTVTMDEIINDANELAKVKNKLRDEDVIKKIQNMNGYKFYVEHISYFTNGNSESNINFSVEGYVNYAMAMREAYNSINFNITVEEPNLLENLAQYFKEAAFTAPTNGQGKVKGWSLSKITIEGALLYAIFIIQSIMYFFAYIKRFFYIVVLAIMAPAVVVIDFLYKSLS